MNVITQVSVNEKSLDKEGLPVFLVDPAQILAGKGQERMNILNVFNHYYFMHTLRLYVCAYYRCSELNAGRLTCY